MTLAEPVIRRPAETEAFDWVERCEILETWNRDDDPAVSIARARVARGVTTRWHRLRGIAERYLVIAGRGRVELGSLPSELLGPGELAYIPPGMAQRISNAGPDDLVFLAICTPRFRRDAYQDIEPS
jgi:mannose-6-phosphate isomerase-like protein (cupin superfamily)